VTISELARHWNTLFLNKDADQVSWYELTPATSLRLIADTPGSVIDVGAGAAALVDALLAAGRDDLTVLDVSSEALEVTRHRLGVDAGRVNFEVTDVTTWAPARRFDVWHDRAVFHFLTDAAARRRYVELATRAVASEGVAVLGTFAADGPTHCSGLPTLRYSAQALGDLFEDGFVLEHHERVVHETPAGAVQPFTWVKLRRR
jgi:SAM-dependent methyltransferase